MSGYAKSCINATSITDAPISSGLTFIIIVLTGHGFMASIRDGCAQLHIAGECEGLRRLFVK